MQEQKGPDYPYIMFARKSARQIVRNEKNEMHEFTGPDTMCFRVEGCHINEESISNVRKEGWNRMIKFDFKGRDKPGSLNYKPEYHALANYLSMNFEAELAMQASAVASVPAVTAEVEVDERDGRAAPAGARSGRKGSVSDKAETGATADVR